jgi:FlaA1/EpsC-like NDP-sugar epimerase
MKTKFHFRNRYVFVIDILLMIISVVGSYALRLEFGAAFNFYIPSAIWMIAAVLLIKPVVYYLFGLYRRVWLYASIQELKLIVIAVSTASILVAGLVLGLFSLNLFTRFPRSVLLIDWVLSILFVGGVRLALRVLAENRNAKGSRSGSGYRVMIVGAGDAGALVVRELQKNPQLNLSAVGFLDDNPAKQRQQIYGIPVLGTLADLAKVLDNHQIDEVIIAIPSAPGRVVRLVADACRLKGIPFRTMPGIYELLGGKVNISRLREVDITDLLRREPTRVKDELVGATITGRVVLVTGAGGSIGRELCRQIARWGPEELLLLGHGENSIFESLLELQESFPSLPVRPIIADVRDKSRLDMIFKEFHPQVVFHAAAHKHVPLMELNIEDAVLNNIQGTKNLVEVALKYDVERLVMISTDKAIRPVNVMGATKRMAEMIVLDAAERTGKAFCVVRFGNVLGSRGSVVPLFKRQIAKGGPVTITHPDMKRYFMTIPEAVYLVLQAAGMSKGAETFVLNMGEQVRILDLAEDLIRLSGLEPGKDIEIVFTGIRPGEKISEDLWEDGHGFLPTEHPEIFMAEAVEDLRGPELDHIIEQFISLAEAGKAPEITELFDQSIPGSEVRSTPPLPLTSIDS